MIPNNETDMEVRQLRALFTMSRELIQADEPSAVLALTGRALADVAHIDSALLLVRGEVDETVSFDSTGRLRQAPCSHDWYRMALERLDSSTGDDAMTDPHTMLVGVPSRHAMAVLAAGWATDTSSGTWAERRRLLGAILELSVATLGRISTRNSLEKLVSTQYQQMAGTVPAHAHEMARRDESEGAMRALALTDVLTGLNNRRGFYVQAEHMFRLARRKHAGGSVIYADIDGLKLVNDQLGHAAGDQLIRDAAAVLCETLRESDVLARVGGDEFVAFVLDDAHPRSILARLADNLQSFNLTQDRSYQLAVSAGAVQCDPEDGMALVDYVQWPTGKCTCASEVACTKRHAPCPFPRLWTATTLLRTGVTLGLTGTGPSCESACSRCPANLPRARGDTVVAFSRAPFTSRHMRTAIHVSR